MRFGLVGAHLDGARALGARLDFERDALAADEAVEVASRIGYPLLVRPSYVLGGRAMEIVHDLKGLHRYMREAVRVSGDSPVLIDSRA